MHYHLITVLVTRVEKWVSERERKRGMDRPVEREREEWQRQRQRERKTDRQTDRNLQNPFSLYIHNLILKSLKKKKPLNFRGMKQMI